MTKTSLFVWNEIFIGLRNWRSILINFKFLLFHPPSLTNLQTINYEHNCLWRYTIGDRMVFFQKYEGGILYATPSPIHVIIFVPKYQADTPVPSIACLMMKRYTWSKFAILIRKFNINSRTIFRKKITCIVRRHNDT